MTHPFPRRGFIRATVAAGTLAGWGDLGFLGRLPRVAAAEARLEADRVRFDPGIEPLVRLIEETARERLLEEVASRIARGTTYREVLTALLLAGVRNIQPRPVGFKFHAVLVVNSAHLASQNAPDADRWLPIFWALDQFKASQARDIQEGDWTMQAVDESAVPPADAAGAAFVEGMDRWDEARVDAACASLARGAGAQEVFDRFCRFGARDFRDIGHKAIYVANSWRTLQHIGWQHAEPVLRSLGYALLEHEGDNPAERDAEPDRPGRRHTALVREIRAGWLAGRRDPGGTREMLDALRHGSWQQAGEKAVALLNRSIAPEAIWDALHGHAAELLMRRPGIVTLHACTTTNALRYAFEQTSRDDTRRFLLLQNAAFLTLFRERAGVGSEAGSAIDTFEAALPESSPAPGDGLDDIFAAINQDKLVAARKALSWLETQGGAEPFLAAAQRLIYLKGTDSHDYKFSSAMFEDHARVSPALRDRVLAASVFWLKGTGSPDNSLVARTRAALG